jgi:hypothetical protein
METTEKKLKKLECLFDENFHQKNNEFIIFYAIEVLNYKGEYYEPNGYIFYTFQITEEYENIFKSITEPGNALHIEKIKIPIKELKEIIKDTKYNETELWKCLVDYIIDYEFWFNKGKNIKNAIVVEWSWETYVGYARKFWAIEYGRNFGFEFESDLVTGNEDRTYRRNYSVLLFEEDIPKNKKQLKKVLESNLLDQARSWKWINMGEVKRQIIELTK